MGSGSDPITVTGDVERQADRDKRPALSRALTGLPWDYTKTFSMTKDVTIQDLPDSKTQKLRLETIKLLFDLAEDNLVKWPGIMVFCQQMESRFQPLCDERFWFIWKIIHNHHHASPPSPVDVWGWVLAVVKAFQSLETREEDASIERACQHMTQGLPPQEVAQNKKQVLQAIFAVLCWSSALLTPVLDNGDSGAPMLSLSAENSGRTYTAKDLRRPLTKMYHSFRLNLPGSNQGCEPDPGQGGVASPYNTILSGSDEVLYQSSLDFFSLQAIGRVKITWVDNITSHLVFDRPNRTLSVFAYPSFCVANVLGTPKISALKSITSTLLPSRYHYDGLAETSSRVHQEIILSYRLLFGQSSKSRSLLLQRLKKDEAAGSLSKTFDPFLYILCTSPLSSFWGKKGTSALPGEIFPDSVRDLDDQLQEEATYLARDDFPVFGHRLLTLQRYNLRQQPSKIRDLWRDKRNPLQWYTFWAVFWVGGVSIILSILQLFISVAQLYVAIQMPRLEPTQEELGS